MCLNDDTTIDGVAWTDYKDTAMSDGYKESDAYLNLGEVDKFIVDELIVIQEAQSNYDSPIGNNDVTIDFTFE